MSRDTNALKDEDREEVQAHSDAEWLNGYVEMWYMRCRANAV